MGSVTVQELANVGGTLSAIQTQLNAITGAGGSGAFIGLLTFTATGSATVGSSYANISGVTNQSQAFPATKAYGFILIMNGMYPSATNADEITFQVMIDDASAAITQTVIYNSDSAQNRRNDAVVATGSITAGTRNVRLQVKALTGGRVTIDSSCTFALLFF